MKNNFYWKKLKIQKKNMKTLKLDMMLRLIWLVNYL